MYLSLTRVAHKCADQSFVFMLLWDFVSYQDKKFKFAKILGRSKQNKTSSLHSWEFSLFLIRNAFICRFGLSPIGWNADRCALPELYSWIPLYKLDPDWTPRCHWVSEEEWGKHNGSPPQRKQTARQMFSCPLLLQNTESLQSHIQHFSLKVHTWHESIIWFI